MQPPLTPMIDITFQLLLFFLITATWRPEGQIPTVLPQLGGIVSGEVVELDPIRISLLPAGGKDGGCLFEVSGFAMSTVDPDKLYQMLVQRREAIQSTDVPIIIVPRPDVPWRYVVEASNQSVRANFKHVGFVNAR